MKKKEEYIQVVPLIENGSLSLIDDEYNAWTAMIHVTLSMKEEETVSLWKEKSTISILPVSVMSKKEKRKVPYDPYAVSIEEGRMPAGDRFPLQVSNERTSRSRSFMIDFNGGYEEGRYVYVVRQDTSKSIHTDALVFYVEIMLGDAGVMKVTAIQDSGEQRTESLNGRICLTFHNHYDKTSTPQQTDTSCYLEEQLYYRRMVKQTKDHPYPSTNITLAFPDPIDADIRITEDAQATSLETECQKNDMRIETDRKEEFKNIFHSMMLRKGDPGKLSLVAITILLILGFKWKASRKTQK